MSRLAKYRMFRYLLSDDQYTRELTRIIWFGTFWLVICVAGLVIGLPLAEIYGR
jgi:hypothetical protein